MKWGAILAAFAAAALWSSALCAAPQMPRDPAFERQLDAEIRARDPNVADRFAEATAARDRGDLDQAATLFDQLRATAPWCVHATRRLCSVELMRDHRD